MNPESTSRPKRPSNPFAEAGTLSRLFFWLVYRYIYIYFPWRHQLLSDNCLRVLTRSFCEWPWHRYIWFFVNKQCKYIQRYLYQDRICNMSIPYIIGYHYIWNNPIDGWLCTIYRWTRPLFKLGLKRPLLEGDIFECLDEHRSAKLTDYFAEVWSTELRRPAPQRPNLIRALFKIYAKKFLLLGVLYNLVDISIK